MIASLGLGFAACQGYAEPLYQFHENLPEAQVLLVKRILPKHDYEKVKQEIKIGQWNGDHFIIEDYPNEAPIKIMPLEFAGVHENVIFFPPTYEITKVIEFYNVKPGASLVVYYGVDDLGVVKDKATIYFSVWVGEHLIERFLIPATQGWRQKVLPLGVVSMLKRDVPVTFEVTTDHPNAKRFGFKAEIVS